MSAVKGRCEVYLDGGVRTGTDVFKALALGAKAVFIGRPAIYGLAYNVSWHGSLSADPMTRQGNSTKLYSTGHHLAFNFSSET